MSDATLKDRMARVIAAVIHRALGDAPEEPNQPVMGDRRKVAEKAADAAIASIRVGDSFGDGLIAVRRESAAEPTDATGPRPQ